MLYGVTIVMEDSEIGK